MGSITGGVIGGLIVAIVIFLVCRELNCWYWKINAHLELMENANSKLAAILDRLPSPGEGNPRKAENISCPQCKQSTAANGAFCENCGYKLT